MTTMEVFKIEKPYITSLVETGLSVTNQDGSIEFYMPSADLTLFTDEWPDEKKIYVNAYLDEEDEAFVIESEAEAPDW